MTETVLITGSAKRLGHATARRLVDGGHKVVVHYHTSSREAKDLVAKLREHGDAGLVQADLDAPDAGRRLLSDAEGVHGPITAVVNNASIFPPSTAAEATWKDLETNMRINAWAPFALTQALAASGHGSCAINMLDTRIVDDDPQHFAYILSKKTLAEMTRISAKEFAPLRVNAVAPGPILASADGDDPGAIGARLPLGRAGTAEEVADAVEYLLRATYTTGQTIFVDGGRHMGRP